jgi:hypothetical protein
VHIKVGDRYGPQKKKDKENWFETIGKGYLMRVQFFIKYGTRTPIKISMTVYEDFFVRGQSLINSSTTAGSVNVEISPRCSMSGSTILRNSLRIILALRVFGKFGVN